MNERAPGPPPAVSRVAGEIVGLVLRHVERINALQTGRVTFHVSGRRVVLEITEAAIAEALVPK